MAAVKEETLKQKGPWSEQEDLQLVCFVRLFGERRWDFIAKVSGLNRTGKSCRLRWVNYLHPGLKRGRMTPQEEHLVLELHSRWGNRWSRIASRLPGRTDNEIKNYWRTHMRKMARERKMNDKSPSLGGVDGASPELNGSRGCSGAHKTMGLEEAGSEDGLALKGYSMDQIWEEMETSETMSGLNFEGSKDEVSHAISYPPPSSDPAWECCYDWLWKTDDEEFRKLHPVG